VRGLIRKAVEKIAWVVLGDTDSIRRVILLCILFILLGPILLIALIVPFQRVRDWIDHFIGLDWR
jgi:adenylylsulfate kinase-like enzyme